MTKLTIGTRGSALALWQANHVKALLEAASPGLTVELLIIKTKGDKILDVPLAKVGGKGLFVKEIEEALLDRRADVAVHSMKDVPAELAPGLVLAAISAREEPVDVLVSKDGKTLAELRPGAIVGTSSVRRVCQLLALRPDLEIRPLRGNVDTRLRKLGEGELDAIVLAAAGLVRLGFGDRISERLDVARCLPAIGQGILAIQTRGADDGVIALVRRAIHDEATAARADAERAFLLRMEGSCTTPLACHAVFEGAELVVHGLVGDPSGKPIIRGRRNGPPAQAAELGRTLADELLGRGAREILAKLR